jgi:hypothetical protein
VPTRRPRQRGLRRGYRPALARHPPHPLTTWTTSTMQWWTAWWGPQRGCTFSGRLTGPPGFVHVATLLGWILPTSPLLPARMSGDASPPQKPSSRPQPLGASSVRRRYGGWPGPLASGPEICHGPPAAIRTTRQQRSLVGWAGFPAGTRHRTVSSPRGGRGKRGGGARRGHWYAGSFVVLEPQWTPQRSGTYRACPEGRWAGWGADVRTRRERQRMPHRTSKGQGDTLAGGW